METFNLALGSSLRSDFTLHLLHQSPHHVLTRSIATLAAVSPVALVYCTENGIVFQVVNNTNTTVAEVNFPKDSFVEFEVEQSGLALIDIEQLSQALNTLSDDEYQLEVTYKGTDDIPKFLIEIRSLISGFRHGKAFAHDGPTRHIEIPFVPHEHMHSGYFFTVGMEHGENQVVACLDAEVLQAFLSLDGIDQEAEMFVTLLNPNEGMLSTQAHESLLKSSYTVTDGGSRVYDQFDFVLNSDEADANNQLLIVPLNSLIAIRQAVADIVIEFPEGTKKPRLSLTPDGNVLLECPVTADQDVTFYFINT